jgi:type IV pilus assembly protein PilC
MPFYTYKARNNERKVLTGLADAPTEEAAIRLLHEKHLFVLDIKESRKGAGSDALLSGFKHVTFSDIVNFTRQLATMTVAGLSISESLNILRSQMSETPFGVVLTEIEHHIVGGGNLADALARFPQYFPPIYTSLVRAGESSGHLDTVLARLADNMEAQREFRGKILGAMMYPAIIIVGMIVVVMIMMTIVVPKLTSMYTDFGISLPWSTQFLINTSNIFVRFWWLMILIIVGMVTIFTRWKKTPIGEYTIDSLILKIPIYGELQKKVILVEFTQTLSMLINSGIRLLDALRILKNALGNVVFRNIIVEVSHKIERGFPLGDSFSEYPVFPPIVGQMIKVGEETGKLDETLSKLSKYFQSESEQLIKGLTTAIEPFIMIVLGLGVGFIVMAVITPIYSLTTQIK